MLYKYPHTYHVPWSENLQNDDKMHPNIDIFNDKEVVVTIKMDGENTTMYTDHIHSRSVDSQFANHESRDRVKAIWGNISYMIPKNIRICGENLYAIHSIKYSNLEDYFLVFSIWDGDKCYSWEDTEYIASTLGLKTVPVIYKGKYVPDYIQNSYVDYKERSKDETEGYVIRIAEEFEHKFSTNNNFLEFYAKFVRKNHVQTDEHWLEHWTPKDINFLRGKK